VCDGTNDYCDVHTNSGIPNKAAYLLTEGDTFNGFTVCGLGIRDAGEIYYRALTIGLWNTPNASFLDARDAIEDAAAVLFPGDLAKTATIQNAFAAVGIGDPYNGSVLCATPSPLSVEVGSSKSLNLLVTNQGVAVSGATITLTIANVNRATVNPGSVVTGSDGQATATVSGIEKGSTILTCSATAAGQAVSSSITVNVTKTCGCSANPSDTAENLPSALIMLMPIAVILLWRHRIKSRRI
jgi:hypothetical protein